jgi:hypothetical protein
MNIEVLAQILAALVVMHSIHAIGEACNVRAIVGRTGNTEINLHG